MIRRQTRDDRPDVVRARAQLEQAKQQRPDVDRLVADLRRERQLNNFTANVAVMFRGGR